MSQRETAKTNMTILKTETRGKTMFIKCTTNEAFEDQLKTGRVYHVKEKKGASYLITNDKEVDRWYGGVKFEPVII